eukprot:2729526-Prymnesium_polylepis.2
MNSQQQPSDAVTTVFRARSSSPAVCVRAVATICRSALAWQSAPCTASTPASARTSQAARLHPTTARLRSRAPTGTTPGAGWICRLAWSTRAVASFSPTLTSASCGCSAAEACGLWATLWQTSSGAR